MRTASVLAACAAIAASSVMSFTTERSGRFGERGMESLFPRLHSGQLDPAALDHLARRRRRSRQTHPHKRWRR